MISRHWKGVVRKGSEADYVEHLESAVIPEIRGIAGFKGVSIMKRTVPNGTEFQIVTLWESMDAIRTFAGDDVEASVVPPRAQALMVEFDKRALHYEVVRALD